MIHPVRYLFMLLALLILGCSGTDEGANKQSTAPASSPKGKVTIYPDNATVQSVIKLSADTTLLANASIDWYVNENVVESSGRSRFVSDVLTKGVIVQAVVTREKKKYYSNEIRIMNTPPMINKAEMVPAVPKAGATLLVEVDAHDADGDTVYYKYKWFLNDKFISDQNYLNIDFKRDDMILIEIVPYDSDDTGSTIFVENKIFNSPPVVAGSTPSFNGKTYTYNLNATDADGDILTYSIYKGPKGMSVDSSGVVTWMVRPEDAGRHEFTVLINDFNGGEVLVPITTRIGFNEKRQK